MKNKVEIQASQARFVSARVDEARRFILGIEKERIDTILLSGSVARGDFFPGDLGGMIDLTAMRKRGSAISAEELFGENEDPGIPFHCVKRNGAWFQIALLDFIDPDGFMTLDEAKKFALFESRALHDPDGRFEELKKGVAPLMASELGAKLRECLGYIGYLLSDYKKDRWTRRNAYVQLHDNLGIAIDAAIRCLYYVNGSYCPAEDRRLYYSHSLERLPRDYADVVVGLKSQDSCSKDDYERREALFRRDLLGFVEAELSKGA